MLRRQTDERLVLCREFWNEYRKFVEWLDEIEKSLQSTQAAMEMPRVRLKQYEVMDSLIYLH